MPDQNIKSDYNTILHATKNSVVLVVNCTSIERHLRGVVVFGVLVLLLGLDLIPPLELVLSELTTLALGCQHSRPPHHHPERKLHSLKSLPSQTLEIHLTAKQREYRATRNR